MSAVPSGIPPLIEQQLLALDKQLRDAAFIRGAGRLVLGICLSLTAVLWLDHFFGLSPNLRGCLLIAWVAIAARLLWYGLIRPTFQPVSFPALSVLVEKQFPDLRERLSSLVELRDDENADLAPGASRLMQDLLARQTIKALDQLSVDRMVSSKGPTRAVFSAVGALLLLLAPFALNADGYGNLWRRFFVPWGNDSWGAALNLKVFVPDGAIARGTDVRIDVSVTDRRIRREIDKSRLSALWLNWRDDSGASDSRQLEWDHESQRFATVLPHVMDSLTLNVTTEGAKSGDYRIDVAARPAITRFKMEIEPAAYTGLPARVLDGVPAEIQVPELSGIDINVEFSEPVSEATLTWPVESSDLPRSPTRPDHRPAVTQSLPFDLAPDRCSGSLKTTATVSGPFAFQVKNQAALSNDDSPRRLLVTFDRPPQIKLSGPDQPVLVRPDDMFEQPIEVLDDFGLTVVELHFETSTGVKQVQQLPAELRAAHVNHTFVIDFKPLALGAGQLATYRVRAIDNRSQPFPNEVWSPARTLMVNTNLTQLPDLEVAADQERLSEELRSVRTELDDVKAEIAEFQNQAEQESKEAQSTVDHNDRLTELQLAQKRLTDQLEQLVDHLADRRMTQSLAPAAQQVADEELQAAQRQLEQSKQQAAHDQLESIAKALDRLDAADQQLQKLEQQLNDLNKLEQDLAELNKMSRRAERLANQLDQLGAERPTESLGDVDANRDHNDKTTKKRDPAQALDGLKNDGQQLADQIDSLLKKYPHLVDAAQREQADELTELADQTRQLALSQEQLAQAIRQAADDAPATATRPENGPNSNHEQPSENGAKPSSTEESNDRPSATGDRRPATDSIQSADEKASADLERGLNKTARPADGLKPDNVPRSSADVGDAKTPALKPDPASQPSNSPSKKATADHSGKDLNSANQQGAAAARQQEQIAQEATRQALDLARDTGADSPATKSAAEFARQADAAKQQTQVGRLADAAKTAREAANAAEETARQLNPDGESDLQQSKSARQLADRQSEAAEQLEQLASSSDASRGAQLQGQRQLMEAANRLAEQLERSAKTPSSVPSGSSQQRAERAKQSVERAEQAMQRSDQANRQNDPDLSTHEAAQAVEQLRQATDEANSATAPLPGSLPVPSKVGAQVVEAKRQLDSAQSELRQIDAQAPHPEPGSSKQDTSESPSESDPASSTPTQSPMGRAAEQFHQAAALLRKIQGDSKAPADRNIRLSRLPTKPPMPSDAASSPDAGQSGNAASGTSASPDLSQLEAELKQQARHNWGRLPGKLKTEILQGAGKSSHPQYSQRIKSYFDEITKPAK